MTFVVALKQGSPGIQYALGFCLTGRRQDSGHTLFSAPARGAFHARGTWDLVGMDVQFMTFIMAVREYFYSGIVPMSTRFSMTAVPLTKLNSEPSIHIR